MIKRNLAWLGLPAAAVLAIVFVFPLAVLGRMAFNRTLSGGAMEEAWTLDTVHEAYADDFTFEITWNSLHLSLLTASLAVCSPIRSRCSCFAPSRAGAAFWRSRPSCRCWSTAWCACSAGWSCSATAAWSTTR
jgi:ABC-type spermidine/putrescine transport system permease subunit II